MAVIKAEPTKGLCYAPNEPLYWDESALDQEVERIFDICQGCRLCFNLCPSFPALFDSVDASDGDVRKLSREQNDEVVDLCYQCKLCYVKCPYTADDGHAFDLDFPRLLLRYNAQRARKKGIRLRERMLGNPVALGRAASKIAGLANWANSVSFHRRIMHSLLGIHRDKKLPEFSSKTFSGWAKSRISAVRGLGAREVVLFHTCFVDYNTPGIGRDAVEVLERNSVRVLSPQQTCCGMPAMDGGDVDFARQQAERNIETLTPYVEKGLNVLAINPTCSYMLKKEYPELVGEKYIERARALSAATRDVCEYLFELKKADGWSREFASSPGEIAYHIPCHLKAQNIGFRSRDMMKTIPGANIRLVDRCCGHDGTWAMKRENFEASMNVGRAAFDEIGGMMVTDCPLAAVHFEQATGTKPLHPLQVLARAYRGDGYQDVGGPAPGLPQPD
jgi:Fe-S oxidoreductase